MTEYLGFNAADVALIVGGMQCGLIAWGIGVMRSSNQGRDPILRTLDQQNKALARLLERTA